MSEAFLDLWCRCTQLQYQKEHQVVKTAIYQYVLVDKVLYGYSNGIKLVYIRNVISHMED